jgi:hypothetical protein
VIRSFFVANRGDGMNREDGIRDRSWLSGAPAIVLTGLGVVAGVLFGFLAVLRLLDGSSEPMESASVREVFTVRSPGVRLLGRGWAPPESWGTWSIGPAAELALDLQHTPAEVVRLSLEARAFPHQPNNRQKINVVVNGVRLAVLEPNPEGVLRSSALDIPAKVASAAKPMRIVFEIARPSSPKDLNVGQDTRKLGIGLTGLSVEYRFKLDQRT